METNILVGDAMTTSPVTCTGDLTLVEVAKLMSSKKVGSILVVKNKRVMGIITEKDVGLLVSGDPLRQHH